MTSCASSTTSVTLLELVRQDPRDPGAWDRFVRRYRPKIFSWCREWGLQEADAEDVAQDVLVRLTEKMANFRYDPITVLPPLAEDDHSSRLERPDLEPLPGRRGQINPDAHEPGSPHDLEKRIEETFDRELLDMAIMRVQERVAPPTWESFRLTASRGARGSKRRRSSKFPSRPSSSPSIEYKRCSSKKSANSRAKWSTEPTVFPAARRSVVDSDSTDSNKFRACKIPRWRTVFTANFGAVPLAGTLTYRQRVNPRESGGRRAATARLAVDRPLRPARCSNVTHCNQMRAIARSTLQNTAIISI